MNAKANAPAMDVLDLLGNQLVLDPESLAMLKQEGKVTEGEFAALMKVIGGGEVSPEGAKKSDELLANSKLLETNPKNLELNQKLNSKLAGPLNEMLAKNTPNKSEQVQVVSKNPNLMNLSKFMDNQTAVTQNRLSSSGGYEATQKSMFVEKAEATNSMAKTGAVNSTKAVTLQDLMFAGNDDANLDSGDESSNQTLNTSKLQSNKIGTETSKIFDMNQLMASDKPMTAEAVIAKIQDHILQTRAGNEKNIEMSFHHKELGQVGLHVQKHAGESIGITISTASLEGAKFFNQNQGELLQSLSTAGIQVGDFKLETSKAGTNLNQNSSDESSKQFAGNNKQGAQSESGERKQEQDKRQTLWEQFSEQQAAA